MTQHALMTTAEVAEAFRCTPRTLWNWRRDGRLRAAKVGRQWLYRRQDIETLCRGVGGFADSQINGFGANNDNGI